MLAKDTRTAPSVLLAAQCVQTKTSSSADAEQKSGEGNDVLREMSHGGHDLLCEIPATRWDAHLALAGVRGLSKDVAGL